MAEKFNVGDIVQLKSGGPKMTVTDSVGTSDDYLRTSWFAGSKHESGMFPVAALVSATDDKSK
jgi:uncharacterized protein YodC (DUF2158 family)